MDPNSKEHIQRKIIHIDMDAYYASIEQRDDPALKNKPIVVGGAPNSRGVVCTCSYEARKFGIHSAMPASKAYRLCPHAVFIKPRFDVYETVSNQIRAIFREYSDLVEPLSLDEAYLDLTENKKGIPSATWAAKDILKKIFAVTGLTASGGVSYNKFLAKVASDINKPNGLFVVTPENADAFIDELPIGKFYGIGKVTEKKMHELGIFSGRDLKRFSMEDLNRYFGKPGEYYYLAARGIDPRPVCPVRERKSVSKERTFSHDLIDVDEMLSILKTISDSVSEWLIENGVSGKTITLKVKYYDFESITRSITPFEPVNHSETIMKYVKELFKNTKSGDKKVRLLGIGVSNFIDKKEEIGSYKQLLLPFPEKRYRNCGHFL